MHYNYARLRLKSSLHPSLKFSISRDFVNCISFTNYYHLHIIKIQWPHTLTRTYYKYYTWINPLLGHAAWHCHVSCITITFSQRFHREDLSPISQANRYTSHHRIYLLRNPKDRCNDIQTVSRIHNVINHYLRLW